jgi:peptide/nickel transport system substrate-binding protein
LRVALADDLESLDPARATRPSAWFFARALYRGLLAFPDEPAPGGQTPVPDIAVALPAVSADGRTYTFRIRDDVRFGDASHRAVRAQDVSASIDRVIATRVGVAPYLSVIVSVSTPDDATVIIHLHRPSPDLPWLLAQPQLSIVPEGTRLAGTVPPGAIPPTGPYRVSSYQPERSLSLERNDDWDATTDPVRGAYVDRIEASIGVPASAAFEQAAAGSIDLALDTGSPDLQFGARVFPPGAVAVRSGNGCVRYLFMNGDVAPFDIGAARLAVASAVQRARFVGAAPGSSLAMRVLPPTVIGNEATPVIPEDVGRARTYLARAHLPRGFSSSLVVGDTPRDRTEAGIVRASLARAGIKIRIRTVPAAELYLTYYEQRGARVPMGIATWCADWAGLAGRDVLGALWGRTSYSHIASTTISRAIASADTAPVSRAASAWAAADARVTGAAAVVPLVWSADEFAVSARLQGLIAAPMWPHGDPTAMWVG